MLNLLYSEIKRSISIHLQQTYSTEIAPNILNIERTNPEHPGHLTVLVFPLAKLVSKKPEELCNSIGDFLMKENWIHHFDIVKGFLNLYLSQKSWAILLDKSQESYSISSPEKVVIEYCGPNTNKPLHIGHLRNVFLGYSMANILEEVGHEVKRVNIYNDRGIAICKSLLAYQLYGQNTTPQSVGKKPDHFVGDFYVKFSQVLKEQIEEGISKGLSAKEAEKEAPITKQNEELLLKWEASDPETMELWEKMNGWFYEGSNQTLQKLGISFDKSYYESQVYLKGKEIVEEGLKSGVFYKDEKGAVIIDLTDKGMDTKVVQRADGTSIYITQDLSLIRERYLDYKMDRMIYVVGDEQNYHFKVLNEICQSLKMEFSKSIYHLSYGMVVGKDGSKFKSREGTAADADDIIADAIAEARNQTIESGKAEGYSEEYLAELSEIIGIGALRFAMLKVGPTKKILFDAKENVDIQGDTAPFVQYSFVRTRAILHKSNYDLSSASDKIIPLEKMHESEEKLILILSSYTISLQKAAKLLDPSEIAQYLLQLAKAFNKFYHNCQILHAEESEKDFRLALTAQTHLILKKCLRLLGIQAPDKM